MQQVCRAGPPDGWTWQISATQYAFCVDGQSVVHLYDYPPPANARGLQAWRTRNLTPTVQVGDLIRNWYRPDEGVESDPAPAWLPGSEPWALPLPEPAPLPMVWPWPSLDPFSLPVEAPMPGQPRAVPYRWLPRLRPNPWRSPTEQTQRGPVTAPRDQVRSGTEFRPNERPRPAARPRLRPPGVGVKERKAEVRGAVQAVHTFSSRVFGETTEFIDAIDAFYEALPEDFQKRQRAMRHGKAPKLTDKLALLYRHWNDVDLNKAIDNLVLNQIEDKLVGKVGQSSKRGTKSVSEDGYYRRPFGPGTGPAL